MRRPSPETLTPNVPPPFKAYLSSILKEAPIAPPEAPLAVWQNLITLLRSHWINPLLYWKIHPLTAPYRPPAIVMDRLREAFLDSRLRAMQMERQLRTMIGAFGENDIPLIVLKGPALARTLYEEPAARPASDLDILVKPADMERARSTFGQLGYRCRVETWKGLLQKTHCEECYDHRELGSSHRMVELHWDLDLFSGLRPHTDVNDFFSRMIFVKTPSFVLPVLHPGDALLHTAVHLSRHKGEERLIWIYDTALLIGRLREIHDWKALQERSVAWMGRVALEDALRLAEDWMDVRPPPGCGDYDAWPKPSVEEIRDRTLSPVRFRARIAKLYRIIQMSRTAPATDRIWFWRRILFPPRKQMRNNYPGWPNWLVPAMYIHRWLKWAARM